MSNVARLRARFGSEIRPALMKEIGCGNLHEVPRLEKIVLNMGLGEAIQNASDAVVAALNSVFDGVQKVTVKLVADAQAGAPRRLTAENVIADRVAMLRKRDPLLDAAIEALDLRLIE